MAITSKTLAQLLTDAAAAVQGAANALVDMSVGSVLRAFLQSVGGIGMWLQGIALQILARSRLATSSGPDVDSWVGDFGYSREGADAANGPVTFGRLTTTTQAIVPIGGIVQTQDGSQTYMVIADTAQAAYSASANGYVMPIGTASIAVTVQSQSTGSSGNAVAGAINTIGSTMPGIDMVTNAAAFQNGEDAEQDAALKTRFVSEINNLSKATPSAVEAAVTSLQPGVTLTLTENANYDGTENDGYFYLVVDDGSGTPSGTFLSTVSNAVDRVRAITSTFGIFAPVVVTANIAMTLTVGSGYQKATVAAAVNTALAAYVNALGLGNSLMYARLSQIAFDATPGVTDVEGVTLNGGTSNLAASSKQVIKPGTVTATAP